MRNRFCLMLTAVLLVGVSPLIARAQGPTGGGSVVPDITGGAALIFRPPQNPTVHVEAGGQGTAGGGKVKGNKPKQPARDEPERILARANAARSAPKPRYEEAEQQYRLAAQVAPTGARAY